MRGVRKRVLVTGGAGFLGSHLCDRLVERGDDVIALDNYYTGTKDNVAHLFDHSNFELMRHDVTFALYVEVDEIYNLACPASPVHYQYDPGPDNQDQRPRRHQHARPRQAREGENPPGLYLRSLRLPGRPPAAGRILGQRQPDRPALLL